jgi:lytic murein transglycosylase
MVMLPARRLRWLLIGLALTVGSGAAFADAPCGGDFDGWLAGVKQEAAAQGISAATIQSALGGIGYDRTIIARDHAQGVFHQSFEQFAGRMVPPRLARARRMMQQYGPLLGRIERQFGVPGAVIVAIWGLETDFGADNGRFPTIRALATLAYDCRRAEKFRGELLAALRIIDRGDMTAAQMHGAWAGEIGQTQFMPSSYLKFAVDFDNNGRRDLLHSPPDVLASTANYLASHGWQKGKGWEPGSPNFAVIQQWNKSDVYARTIAYFATQLSHAP